MYEFDTVYGAKPRDFGVGLHLDRIQEAWGSKHF